jgi:hypothetical protein
MVNSGMDPTGGFEDDLDGELKEVRNFSTPHEIIERDLISMFVVIRLILPNACVSSSQVHRHMCRASCPYEDGQNV